MIFSSILFYSILFYSFCIITFASDCDVGMAMKAGYSEEEDERGCYRGPIGGLIGQDIADILLLEDDDRIAEASGLFANVVDLDPEMDIDLGNLMTKN
jgi:hypothetical protein